MSQSSRAGHALPSAIGLLVLAVALGVPGTVLAQDPHVVFVTSAAGTGDLGDLASWPDADFGASGVDAADSVCRNLASSAGLNDPNDFVAWLSDSDDDAYCRVHGLTGKVSANCGQGELPVAAGPWVRTDGFPFAPTIDLLLAPTNQVFTPLKYDESGLQVSGSTTFTGTGGTGAAAPELCSDGLARADWASDSGAARVGTTYETGDNWTWAHIGTCSVAQHLVCMEKGQGGPLPAFAEIGKRIFVTSTSGIGDLASWPDADPGVSGIAAGDSICKNLADAAGLPVPSSFKAWLSDSGTDAKNRFVNPGPWVRVDGVVVFQSPADLVTHGLFTAVNVTESGEYLAGGRAWTGTWSTGTADTNACGDWQVGTSGPEGRAGLCTSTTTGWTANTTFGCDNSFHLYCLAVDNGIFGDGFERGDTSAW